MMDMVRDPITGKPAYNQFSPEELFGLLLDNGLAAWNAFDGKTRERLEKFIAEKFYDAQKAPEPVAALYLYEMLKRLTKTGAPVHGEYVDA